MNRYIDPAEAAALERRLTERDVTDLRADRRLSVLYTAVCAGFVLAGILGLLLSSPIDGIG